MHSPKVEAMIVKHPSIAVGLVGMAFLLPALAENILYFFKL
jgi:hypothetical protein